MNKKKILRGLVKWICIIVVITIIQLSFTVGMEGMWLLGIPAPDKVASVTIEHPSVTDEVLEITDREQVKTCVHLSGFLKYKPFANTEIATGAEEKPITLIYHTFDGKDIEVSANSTFVFYKGKTHVIKDDGSFVKFVEALFYQEYFVE